MGRKHQGQKPESWWDLQLTKSYINLSNRASIHMDMPDICVFVPLLASRGLSETGLFIFTFHTINRFYLAPMKPYQCLFYDISWGKGAVQIFLLSNPRSLVPRQHRGTEVPLWFLSAVSLWKTPLEQTEIVTLVVANLSRS